MSVSKNTTYVKMELPPNEEQRGVFHLMKVLRSTNNHIKYLEISLKRLILGSPPPLIY